MKGFYATLQEGTDPINALHKSKTDFLKTSDEFNAHPSNWASYIVMGKPDGSLKHSGSSPWLITLISVGGILVLLVLLAVVYRFS